MRVKIGNGLLALNLLVIALIIVVIFFPHSVVRVILGLPTVLFFPGYTLMAALFPRRGRMANVARLALSLGMSITVLPLIGLILNYTPWGIRLEPVLYSVTVFIFAASIAAWLRRKRLPNQERFGIEFELKVPLRGRGGWDRVLIILLVTSILVAVGALSYVLATPKVGEKFTEFYILGIEGKATDYPRELTVGEKGTVILGIVNQEHEATSYRVEVRINGINSGEIGPTVLEHDEKWEEKVSFIPQVIGEKQKIEFLLYRNGEAEPYLEPLNLWFDVREQ